MIKQKVATSQNAVDPPLPSTTSYPSGRLNKSFKPLRTRPTTFFTAGWRCDVPKIDEPLAANAASASGRIFEGPQPKRPSFGLRLLGIIISLAMR